MDFDLLKLLLVFLVLVVLIFMKKPLFFSVLTATIAACVCFLMPPLDILSIAVKSVFGSTTLMMVLTMYLVTLLQHMLQKRGHIDLAKNSLSAIFNNRLVNASVAPIFIGLLPTASAAFIAGDMVEGSIGSYLSKEEKAANTSYFRHIPEAFMPTYSGILLALSISGIPAYSFVSGMAIPVIALIFLGFFFFLRKVPKDTGIVYEGRKREHTLNLFRSMWTIMLIIALILFLKIEVYIATILTLCIYFIVEKFKITEIASMIPKAFEVNIILNLVMLVIFKDVLTATGSINALPKLFESLPLPTFIIYMLLFFFGTVLAGSQAIIAICMPMAYLAIPDGGLSLLVLLMCASFAAMQISPTHICLALISEYFKVSLGDMVKKTMPIIAVFMIITPLYYLIMRALGL